MRRRDFLKNVIFIPAAGMTVSYVISSCGGGGGGTDTTGGTGESGTPGMDPVGTCTVVQENIGLNHGHTVMPPTAAELGAGMDIELTLMLAIGHTHLVTLTAQDLDTISTCGFVSRNSTVDGVHSHLVTFTGVA